MKSEVEKISSTIYNMICDFYSYCIKYMDELELSDKTMEYLVTYIDHELCNNIPMIQFNDDLGTIFSWYSGMYCNIESNIQFAEDELPDQSEPRDIIETFRFARDNTDKSVSIFIYNEDMVISPNDMISLSSEYIPHISSYTKHTPFVDVYFILVSIRLIVTYIKMVSIIDTSRNITMEGANIKKGMVSLGCHWLYMLFRDCINECYDHNTIGYSAKVVIETDYRTISSVYNMVRDNLYNIFAIKIE